MTIPLHEFENPVTKTSYPVLLCSQGGKMFDDLESGVRVAEGLQIHGAIDFRSLCEHVVDDETEYLVLDLDKTIHLGHNVGEMLGWELSAYEGYGEPYLRTMLQRTDRNRQFFDWGNPWGLVKYLSVALRRWALPGLFYFLFVRVAAKTPRLRRMVFRRFGLEPVDAVQSGVREALLHQLSNIPLETAREIVRQVWRRLEPDQVVMAEDIAYLKERYPNLHIVLSSASPQPVLEVAQARLGVHAVFYTEVEEHEGYLSLPHETGCNESHPRRLSPPSKTVHNASAKKIERLREVYPRMFAEGASTVGITDTSYGEDHVWAHHFRTVVDINSPTPFVPIVASNSPLKTIHSADVLTKKEIARRAAGEAGYLDPRRKRFASGNVHFSAHELQTRLQAQLDTARNVLAAYRTPLANAVAAKKRLIEAAMELANEAEQNVQTYNRSLGRARRDALKKMRSGMRRMRKLRRRIVSVERPLADAAYQMSLTLEQARASLVKELNPR